MVQDGYGGIFFAMRPKAYYVVYMWCIVADFSALYQLYPPSILHVVAPLVGARRGIMGHRYLTCSGTPCGQYISNKKPSRFVILSGAKDLCPDRDPSLRSG